MRTRFWGFILIVISLAIAGGCVSSSPAASAASAASAAPAAGPAQHWVDQWGGTPNDAPRLQRLQTVARPLLDHLETTPSLRILNTARAVAFSWPSGDIFVSRRLVDCLNDQELAAVVAHELGHLVGGGHVAASLRGNCGSNLDAEGRADAVGVQLLEKCGIPSSAMTLMLQKVRDASMKDSNCEKGLSARIARLQETTTITPIQTAR